MVEENQKENNGKKPLEFYKNPLYVSGGITLILFILFVWMFINKNMIMFVFLIFCVLMGFAAYYVFNNQCPQCKRIFSKSEVVEWKEDLGVKKEPYIYYARKFQYDDGSIVDDESSKKTIQRDRRVDRHYYLCKKCNHGSEREWSEKLGTWLGEEPKSKIVRKKGNPPEGNIFSLDLFSDESYEYEDEQGVIRRKSIPKSVKNDLWVRDFGKVYKGKCFVCSKTIDTKNFEVGHIKAVAKGGSDKMSNLKCICGSCNKSMGTRNLNEFKKKYYGKSKK